MFSEQYDLRAILETVNKLYEIDEWTQKAEKVRAGSRTFDGGILRHHAVRKRTEPEILATAARMRQYAFFFKITAPEAYPELYKTLISDFGHIGSSKGLYPEVQAGCVYRQRPATPTRRVR